MPITKWNTICSLMEGESLRDAEGSIKEILEFTSGFNPRTKMGRIHRLAEDALTRIGAFRNNFRDFQQRRAS